MQKVQSREQNQQSRLSLLNLRPVCSCKMLEEKLFHSVFSSFSFPKFWQQNGRYGRLVKKFDEVCLCPLIWTQGPCLCGCGCECLRPASQGSPANQITLHRLNLWTPPISIHISHHHLPSPSIFHDIPTMTFLCDSYPLAQFEAFWFCVPYQVLQTGRQIAFTLAAIPCSKIDPKALGLLAQRDIPA